MEKGFVMTAKTTSRTAVLSVADRNVILEYAGLINHGHVDVVALLAEEFISGAKSAAIRLRRLWGLSQLVEMVKECDVLLDCHVRNCWSGSGVTLDRSPSGEVVINSL